MAEVRHLLHGSLCYFADEVRIAAEALHAHVRSYYLAFDRHHHADRLSVHRNDHWVEITPDPKSK